MAIVATVFGEAHLTRLLQDTTRRDSLNITPYSKITTLSLANYAYVEKDVYAFQTYSGLNALNTLRGHVPGLKIGRNAALISDDFMGALVIDGVAYSRSFEKFFNLSAYQFENITFFSRGHSAWEFGGQAPFGVVILESKSGKNIRKPTFEYNLAPTFISMKGSSFHEPEQMWISQNFAHNHDYGATDLRVGYNVIWQPDIKGHNEVSSGFHHFKVNLGIDVTKHFSIRAIVDAMYGNTGVTPLGTVNSNFASRQLNIQQNIKMTYQIKSWLVATSQNILSALQDKYEAPEKSLLQRAHNRRHLINLFLNARQRVTDALTLSAFTGLQYEYQFGSVEDNNMDIFRFAFQEMQHNTQSSINGVGFEINNYWFNNLKLRFDEVSVPELGKPPTTFSVGSSFIFSKAFNLENDWISSGKFRGSFGDSGTNLQRSYPYIVEFQNFSVMPNEFSSYIKRTVTEVGTDFSFFKKRVDASISFFFEKNSNTFVRKIAPESSEFDYMLVDLGPAINKGWELVLAGDLLQRGKLKVRSTLTWTSSKNMVGEVEGTTGSTATYGNPYPDWIGGLLNSVTFNRLFASMLIDMQKGGSYYDIISPSEFVISKGTYAKVRDFSIGYMAGDKLKLSLSARNPLILYSRYEGDIEARIHNTNTQQSYSFNLSVTF
jgi:hypothetical protein